MYSDLNVSIYCSAPDWCCKKNAFTYYNAWAFFLSNRKQSQMKIWSAVNLYVVKIHNFDVQDAFTWHHIKKTFKELVSVYAYGIVTNAR